MDELREDVRVFPLWWFSMWCVGLSKEKDLCSGKRIDFEMMFRIFSEIFHV